MPQGNETLIENGTWKLRHLWNGPDIVLRIALQSEGSVAISTAAGETLVTLGPSQWSEPLTIPHEGRNGIVDVSFRIKVLHADRDVIRLFNTPLHERTGHSTPEFVWQSILETAGPIEEQSDPSLMFASSLDLETQLEIFRLNVAWLGRVAERILLDEPWDLLMLHTHVLDWAHHLLQGGLDPRHPSHDPALAPKFTAAIDGVYELVDRWIASIATAAGPGVNLVVAGDHGQDVVHSVVHLNEWLARERFLVRDEAGEIVWSATRAWAAGNYIYLNLADRDEGGIVSAQDAGALRETIIARLYELTDPRDGAPPVLIAGPKESFERFGANGAGSGDIVLCFRSGYQASNAFGELFERTEPLRAFTSNHDHYWPLDPRILTRFIACGPSFEAGYVHPQPEPITRIAATLSAALGSDRPKHAQGEPIAAILRDGAERVHESPTGASATWPL